MAAINNYGLNFADKNRARKLRDEQGMQVTQIAAKLRCKPEVISAYFRTQRGGTKPAPVVEEAPLGNEDEFGPLPGSNAWSQLTPGEKGSITKRRNAA